MNQIKYWVAIGTEEQLDFEGRTHIKDVLVGEVHIVYSEVLMCRQSRDRLKGDLKAKKHKTVVTRPAGKLCPKCEKKFKEHPDLVWSKWVSPPEVRQHKPIETNPALLERK